MSGRALEVDLFAVQSRVSLEDYASLETFVDRHRVLAERVDALRTRGADGRPVRPALAVWPEMVGAPLGVIGYRERVARCRSTGEAMARIARAEWPRMFRSLRRRPRSLAEALHLALAPRVHRAMWTTFSRIARDFGLWVVAGSALLPENALGEDTPEFRARNGRVYNTSYTFSPEGRCVAVTRKVNLVPAREDLFGVTRGRAERLPVVDTPFGRLGTLISYDGFLAPLTDGEPDFTPAALLMDALAVDVIAQPSANSWPWEGPAAFAPPDSTLRRCEQWRSEGLQAQLQEMTDVRYVVCAQLTGGILDTVFEAPSCIFERRDSGQVQVLVQAASPHEECVLQVCTAGAGAEVAQASGAGM